MLTRRPLIPLPVALAVATLLLSGLTQAQGQTEARSRELEGRLLAPCCWVQTLDIHESELATSLRAEIRQRLERGEAAEAIEDDLATRHGERIRAVPRGKDPRKAVLIGTGIAMLLTLAGILLALRRWQRAAPVSPPPEPQAEDAYDERLDEELSRIQQL